MKRLFPFFVALVVLLGSIQAQTHSDKLDRLAKRLQEKIEKDVSGWNHRSITPIEGSKDIIVEQWETGNLIVRVSVIEYAEEEDAQAALKDFRRHLEIEEQAAARRKVTLRKIKGELPDLGDGGFLWDTLGSDAAAFRSKNFLVFVSVTGPPNYNDTVLSKRFAKYAADALATQ